MKKKKIKMNDKIHDNVLRAFKTLNNIKFQSRLATYEAEYSKLTDFEKHIITTTSLSIEDINYYKQRLNRNLTEKELKIAGLLRNHGVVLQGNDFFPFLK